MEREGVMGLCVAGHVEGAVQLGPESFPIDVQVV